MDTENRSLTIKWWLITPKGFVHSPAIVAAESPEKIRESIPLFKEKVDISPLLWADLTAMLPVVIPKTKNFTEQATGPLTIKTGVTFVSVIVT